MNPDISILFEDFGSLNTCAFILTTFGVQGGVLSQIGLLLLGPKMYTFFAPVSPRLKIFLFSHWNLIDHIQIDNQYDF